MKNPLFLTLALLLSVACSPDTKVPVGPTDVPVAEVGIDQTSFTLDIGDTRLLTATVLPDDATDKAVVWRSSLDAVATIDGDGLVTAVAAGMATITATAGDKSATCMITVVGEEIPVSEITLDRESLVLVIGSSALHTSAKLTATVNPENATDRTVVWESSAPAVATVDNDGSVTAVSAGSATVTATAGGKSAECVVTVTEGIEAGVAGSLFWVLTSDYTLIISGEGAMPDYDMDVNFGNVNTPWYEHIMAIAKVIIEPGVTHIGDFAFANFIEGASLLDVSFPESLTSIGEYAFWHCNGLTEIILPANVATLGEGVFYYCSGLTDVVFAEGSKLTTLSANTFFSCPSLKNVTLPAGLMNIGKYAFAHCFHLSEITVPSVRIIDEGAFYNCQTLKNVSLPEGLTSLGIWAFSTCKALESIVFPSTLTKAEMYIFASCDALTAVTCKAAAPPSVMTGFGMESSRKIGTLYVPAQSLQDYQSAVRWSDAFATITAIQ